MNVYETIKKLRKIKDLTQAEVAEKLSIAPSNYTMLEQGKTELTYSKMIKLAEIFGVSVVELLGEGASVVVVGANDSTKELEALKQKFLDLQEKTILQTKIVNMWEAYNETTMFFLEEFLATEIYYYEIEDKELGTNFVMSFIEDVIYYLDYREEALKLLSHIYKGYSKDEKHCFDSLLATYTKVFESLYSHTNREKKYVANLFETYKKFYNEELLKNQSETICFFNSLKFTRADCLVSTKKKIDFFSRVINNLTKVELKTI